MASEIKEYSDSEKKNQTYEIISEKFKDLGPEATRGYSNEKNNSLRTLYRKELSKLRSAVGDEDYL